MFLIEKGETNSMVPALKVAGTINNDFELHKLGKAAFLLL